MLGRKIPFVSLRMTLVHHCVVLVAVLVAVLSIDIDYIHPNLLLQNSIDTCTILCGSLVF